MIRIATLAVLAGLSLFVTGAASAATCKAQGREDNKMYTASAPQAPAAQTKAVQTCLKNKKNRACLARGCN